MTSEQPIAWYVLRVTYQRELQVRDALERMGIEAFVPERLVRRRDSRGRFNSYRESALHNYLFARTAKHVIDELKSYRLPMLRYVMHVTNGIRCPMIVPDIDMEHFMAIAAHLEDRILYLSPAEPELREGDRVRITGGPFAGVEGRFIRLRQAKERRVVVVIEGVAAVATAVIPSMLVEKIPDNATGCGVVGNDASGSEQGSQRKNCMSNRLKQYLPPENRN